MTVDAQNVERKCPLDEHKFALDAARVSLTGGEEQFPDKEFASRTAIVKLHFDLATMIVDECTDCDRFTDGDTDLMGPCQGQRMFDVAAYYVTGPGSSGIGTNQTNGMGFGA